MISHHLPSTMRCLALLLFGQPAAALLSPSSQKALLFRLPPLVSLLSDARWTCYCIQKGWRPLEVGKDVEVKPTGDDRGNGLFALREIDANTLVSRYTGVIMTDEAFAKSDSTGSYAFDLGNGMTVEGDDPRRTSFVRYINHSLRRANCEAVSAWNEEDVTGAVYIQTTKRIRAGEEIFFDYGPGYWDQRAPRYSPQRFKIDFL